MQQIDFNLPFEVQQLGVFRDGRMLFKKCCGEYAQLNYCNEGAYLRENGAEALTLLSEGCTYKSYNIKKPLSFVFYQNSCKYDIDKLKSLLIAELSKHGTISTIVTDKETIKKEEKMQENLYDFLKFNLTIEYNDSGICDIDCNC